jgi:outer membrane protein assembly factor BamB
MPGTETWQSPVVVDDVLLIGDCVGTMHAYDVADRTKQPKPLWQKLIGGCIESTPAVWKGTMYFGTRAGGIHALSAR